MPGPTIMDKPNGHHPQCDCHECFGYAEDRGSTQFTTRRADQVVEKEAHERIKRATVAVTNHLQGVWAAMAVKGSCKPGRVNCSEADVAAIEDAADRLVVSLRRLNEKCFRSSVRR